MIIYPIGSNMTGVEGSFQTGAGTQSGIVLVSYTTPVAAQIADRWFVTEQYHSVTTSRHVNKWLASYGIDRRSCRSTPQDWFDNLLVR